MGTQLLPEIKIELIAVDGYEKVYRIVDKGSKLLSFIAIHNTKLGPALGGVRIHPYATEKEALSDVLRLSKGMTYKSAVAEVGFGGGKAVIIADPKKDKTEELLLAFGSAVEALKGEYITAEDVGCSTEDIAIIRRATRYVTGVVHPKSSGNPAPYTAWGTYRGILATAKHLFGTPSLEGRQVAVQGLGHVGSLLVEFLFWAGADLIVADLDEEKAKGIAKKWGAQAVSAKRILEMPCDILVPCAMGGIVNDETLPKFRCKAIAGSANNQLLEDRHAKKLQERGILYAPDFVINAGGLLNVAAELEPEGYLPTAPRRQLNRIYDSIDSIYAIAAKNKISTNEAALSLAEYRLKYEIGRRAIPPHFHHYT